MGETDFALEGRFRIMVDRRLGEPEAPIIIRLADLLGQSGLPASGLADEKACPVPIKTIEHFGTCLAARQRGQVRNLAADVSHELAA